LITCVCVWPVLRVLSNLYTSSRHDLLNTLLCVCEHLFDSYPAEGGLGLALWHCRIPWAGGTARGTVPRGKSRRRKGDCSALFQPRRGALTTNRCTTSIVSSPGHLYTHHATPVLDRSGCGMHCFDIFNAVSTSPTRYITNRDYACTTELPMKHTPKAISRCRTRAVLLSSKTGIPLPQRSRGKPQARQSAAGAPHARSTIWLRYDIIKRGTPLSFQKFRVRHNLRHVALLDFLVSIHVVVAHQSLFRGLNFPVN
jgi:hypothetical protein